MLGDPRAQLAAGHQHFLIDCAVPSLSRTTLWSHVAARTGYRPAMVNEGRFSSRLPDGAASVVACATARVDRDHDRAIAEVTRLRVDLRRVRHVDRGGLHRLDLHRQQARRACLETCRRDRGQAGLSSPRLRRDHELSGDVFVSYHTPDRAAVFDALADRDELAQWRSRTLVDTQNPPGASITELMNTGVSCPEALYFVGPHGQGPHQRLKLNALIARPARPADALNIVPVILPGATDELIAPLLRDMVWIDLRGAEATETRSLGSRRHDDGNGRSRLSRNRVPRGSRPGVAPRARRRRSRRRDHHHRDHGCPVPPLPRSGSHPLGRASGKLRRTHSLTPRDLRQPRGRRPLLRAAGRRCAASGPSGRKSIELGPKSPPTPGPEETRPQGPSPFTKPPRMVCMTCWATYGS